MTKDWISLFVVPAFAALAFAGCISNPESVTVYDDALASGWDNSSWGTSVDFADTSVVAKSGGKSARITIGAGDATNSTQGFSAQKEGASLSVADFTQMSFYVYALDAATAAQVGKLSISLENGTAPGEQRLLSTYATVLAGEWTHVEVPIGDIAGGLTQFTHIKMRDSTGTGVTFNLDQLTLDEAGAPDPLPSPGYPKPAASCAITQDADGFFTVTTGSTTYTGRLPSDYDGTKPTQLVVGMHGCGDTAYNFATWAVNPPELRATQRHIGISLNGGRDGQCWDTTADEAKVLAAADDVAKCFWVDKSKVVLAGYSSGGILAYWVGLRNASRFAGILIENAGFTGGDEDPLIAGATRKINIAHLQNTGDLRFPIVDVRASWDKFRAAGWDATTLQTIEQPGTHETVTSTDWATSLLPRAIGWALP